MGDLSPHFSRWEFAEHGSGALPFDPAPQLLGLLEVVRFNTGGRPLRIVSGYRSASYNRRIGGAPDSQHIYGRAADIEPGRLSVDQAVHFGARGVGYNRDGWVIHLDVRPGAPVTFLDV